MITNIFIFKWSDTLSREAIVTTIFIFHFVSPWEKVTIQKSPLFETGLLCRKAKKKSLKLPTLYKMADILQNASSHLELCITKTRLFKYMKKNYQQKT